MSNTAAFPDHRLYLDLIPLGLVFMDIDSRIIVINRYALEMLRRNKEELLFRHWNEVFMDIPKSGEAQSDEMRAYKFSHGDDHFLAQYSPIFDDGVQVGYLLVFQKTDEQEKISQELDSYKSLHADLKAIFDISYDVIFVSDGNGVTQRVSAASERLWGYKESDLIGKSIYQLEKEGVFHPSATRLVLEKKDKISIVQTTKTGKRLMVVGTPIKDEEGRIIRVVNASRDITEISQLQSELEMMKQLTAGYRQELDELRKQNDAGNKLVYRSEQTKRIVLLSQKVAGVDTPVLLLGESGVGKEVVASQIHRWSKRNKQPFITLNCGALPENLMELEMFGDEEGGWKENEQRPRRGAFEMANEGTLFLDDIDAMPIHLQIKLLRVLRNGKVIRIGGTVPIPVNVRIIASTHRNLQEEIQAGRFREDLYYQLNIVPIAIPPLKERKEDILPLTLHFIQQLNNKYGFHKQFSAQAAEKLQYYAWPGNVRELQNLIERLLVTTDGNMIGIENLPENLLVITDKIKPIEVHELVHLKEAVGFVEKELLEMARNKYSSMTKMGEMLGVDQSTVSRKLKEYFGK